MTEDIPKPRKPKRSRFTLAPLYLAVGLAVCYLVLTIMVPAMIALAGKQAINDQSKSGWAGFTMRLSERVQEQKTFAICIAVVIGVAGFVLPFIVRSARYLVWVLALGVFLLDIALAAGSWWSMMSSLIKDATTGVL